jgi:hypothetical protein
MKSKWWHKWFRLNRLIPLATIIAVFVAILLSVFQVVQFSFFENLVLTLLGLIAVDAFVERMEILERILKDVEPVANVGPELLPEQILLTEKPFKKFINGAEEIFIFGGSLAGLFSKEYKCIDEWLASKSNTMMKIILVDPELVLDGKITVQSLFRYLDWDEKTARDYYAHETLKSLKVIQSLQKTYPDRIRLRLTKETPSVTILMADKRKARVSINLYQNDPTERPIFEVDRDDHYSWYLTFEKLYYHEIWENSRTLDVK